MKQPTAYDKKRSVIFAKRLLELRKANGKSRERVTAELSDPEGQYGIEISVDSLCNYEQAVPGKRGIYSNDAMKVGYLRAFADYYGVSTDFLLGLSDHMAMDAEQPTLKDLNFTDKASQNVKAIMENEEQRRAVNALFTHYQAEALFQMIADFDSACYAWCLQMEASIQNILPESLVIEDKKIKSMVDLYDAKDDPDHPAFEYLNIAGGLDPVKTLRHDISIAVTRFLDDLLESAKNTVAKEMDI